jgi:tartrate-resistant acid phosphatase type 5
MSKPTWVAVTRLKSSKESTRYILLAVSLLLVFQQACQPVGSTGSAVLTPASQPARLATITPSSTQEVLPSETSTPTRIMLPPTPSSTSTQTPSPTATIAIPVVFAAIGDYGTGDQNEADVANLILSWNPEFIITLGDNNYPTGAADHMDQAVGQFFHSYIYPYSGNYSPGAEVNRFFPSLGNHDLMAENGQPYYDYFTLPGNERYYDFTWGPVHLFALDDIDSEPDGVGVSSKQAEWLKAGLAESTSAWNIVYMHYPPYSSGLHGSTDWARWPYREWGADAVLAGHDHTYERLEENGLPFFINGLGGGGIYNFPNIVDGSLMRYNADYGAMRIEVTDSFINFEFINRDGELVDTYRITQ